MKGTRDSEGLISFLFCIRGCSREVIDYSVILLFAAYESFVLLVRVGDVASEFVSSCNRGC